MTVKDEPIRRLSVYKLRESSQVSTGALTWAVVRVRMLRRLR